MEDSFYQAARALTDERKEYIASIIKNGLSDEQFEHIRYKKLLSLLSELSDIEVIILRAYTMYPGEEAEEFFEKHQQVVKGPIVTMESPRDEINKEIIHKTHRAFLARLGLLRPHFMGLKEGELPQFDKSTGTFKTNNYQITPLGRLLLRHIDLIE